jgi:hypothetical protein
MCICDIGIEKYCQFHGSLHRSEYPGHELHPLSQKIDESTYDYLLKILKINNGNIKESIELAKKYIKTLNNLIKKTTISLNELEENYELILQLIKQLEANSSSLTNFSVNNLDCFLKTQKNSMEKYFKEIFPIPEFPHINRFEINPFNDFFTMLGKISKPILINHNPVIQSDPSAFFKQNSDFRSVYFNACYRNENVTVKRINDVPVVENDLSNHEEAMKNHPNKMLKIYTRYRDKGKQIVITELWTHTIWNEIHTRKFEDCLYDTSFIVEILRDLLRVFKDDNRFLQFTPNVLHMTSQSNYKIWYPHEINLDSILTETTYLSPNLEHHSTSLKAEILPEMHNIFSLGLVVLQIATLADTSELYKEAKRKDAEELVMRLPETPLRAVLIGILLRSEKHRFTFEKALEWLSS